MSEPSLGTKTYGPSKLVPGLAWAGSVHEHPLNLILGEDHLNQIITNIHF